MSACGGIRDIALNPVHWDLDPKEASSQAAAFFMNFRKRFVEAPIEEKKALVGQVVIEITLTLRKNRSLSNNENPDGESSCDDSFIALGIYYQGRSGVCRIPLYNGGMSQRTRHLK